MRLWRARLVVMAHGPESAGRDDDTEDLTAIPSRPGMKHPVQRNTSHFRAQTACMVKSCTMAQQNWSKTAININSRLKGAVDRELGGDI